MCILLEVLNESNKILCIRVFSSIGINYVMQSIYKSAFIYVYVDKKKCNK